MEFAGEQTCVIMNNSGDSTPNLTKPEHLLGDTLINQQNAVFLFFWLALLHFKLI
jgi:hypothetical protein